MKTVVVVLLLVSATLPSNFQMPPNFFELPSSSENSVLSGECTFTSKDENNIECEFVQIGLMYPDTLVNSELKKAHLDIEKQSEKERKKDFGEACKSIQLERPKIRMGINKAALYKEVDELCKGQFSLSDAKRMTQLFVQMKFETCRVWQFTNTVSFERMGMYKWVSDSSPSGLCKISTVATLESTDGSLWTYSQTRMGVGNSDSNLCKDKEKEVGIKKTYSWQEDKTFDLRNCKYLSFGY